MKYLLLIFSLFSLFSSFAFAQQPQEVTFSFVNGPDPVQDVVLLVFFPESIQSFIRPAPNGSQLAWDSDLGILSISVGTIAGGAEARVPIFVEGRAGSYQLDGRIMGRWQDGQEFQSETITLQFTLFEPTVRESLVEDLRRNDNFLALLRSIGVPIAVALGIMGTAALAQNTLSSSAVLAAQIFDFGRFLVFGIFRRKKRMPWGIVKNKITGKPIKGATVQLYSVEFNQLKNTQYTDADGRFGFLTDPEQYYVVVTYRGFQELKTQMIELKEGEENALNLELYLYPETAPALAIRPIVQTIRGFLKFLEKINPLILTIGTIISFASIIIDPRGWNYLMFVLYIIVDILNIYLYFKKQRSSGEVLDTLTKQPLDLAVVRLFNSEKNWLLNSQVTALDGKFKFLVLPGEYYVTCAHAGYQPYTSQTVVITKEAAITWEIPLQKI